jgi:hypothetical protein
MTNALIRTHPLQKHIPRATQHLMVGRHRHPTIDVTGVVASIIRRGLGQRCLPSERDKITA